MWQVSSQPSPETLFPSSHSVGPALGSKIPSPQTDEQAPVEQVGSALQSGVQPSRQFLLPSSHGSLPSCLPLPHTALPLQSCGVVSVQVLPGSILHRLLQPSLSSVSPSSHCSLPSFLPSPQTVRHGRPSRGQVQPSSMVLQSALQPSLLFGLLPPPSS